MWKKRYYKVLIIDDAKQCKKTIQKLFSQRGVESDYSDIDSVHDKIKVVRPDMILFDTEILKQSGTGLLRNIVSSYAMPIVVLGNTGEDVLDAMFAGAKDCIPKPNIGSPKSVETFIDNIVAKLKASNTKSGLYAIFG